LNGWFDEWRGYANSQPADEVRDEIHDYPYRRGDKGEELDEFGYIQLPTNAAVILLLGAVITLPPSLLLGHDSTMGCRS